MAYDRNIDLLDLVSDPTGEDEFLMVDRQGVNGRQVRVRARDIIGNTPLTIGPISRGLGEWIADSTFTKTRVVGSGAIGIIASTPSANLVALSRKSITAGRGGASQLQFVYTNKYVASGAGETNGANDITVAAALELTTDVGTIPVWFGGKSSVVIPPGGTVTSDPIGVDLAPGELAFARTLVSVADSAKSWPVSGFPYGDTGVQRGAAYPTDPGTLLATGAIAGGASQTDAFYPLAVLGISKADTAVGILSDSIGYGIGDTAGSANLGYIVRGLASVNGYPVPYTRLARSGDRLSDNTPLKASTKHSMLRYCTHVFVALGTNDIISSATGQQVIDRLTARYTSVLRSGAQPIGVTLVPRVTSTDSYATLANQTPIGGFGAGAARDVVNDWIRAGGGGLLSGYIDPCTVAEAPSDRTKWAVNGATFYATTDGVHPSPAMHALMAPLVTAYVSALA